MANERACFRLGRLSAEHLAAARTLSAAEGWPHTEADWRLLLEQGHGLGAFDGGTLCGTAIGFSFGHVSAIGMVMTAAPYRRQGIGRALMMRLEEALGDGTLLLCATADGAPLYRVLGFDAVGEIAQCQGAVADVPARADPPCITQATQDAMAHVFALDQAARGWDRRVLLTALAEEGTFWTHWQQEGYALVRASGRGHVIGPIVAPTRDVALDLVEQIIAQRGPGFYRVDTPPELGLVPALDRLGLVQVAVSAVMQKGPALPCKNPHHLFGLSSQALG